MSSEPILSDEDVAVWDSWTRAARVHAKTQRHAQSLDAARRLVNECLERHPDAAVMWSGGKDSTAMTHLVCVECGARDLAVYSEKDDLDYPGERAYVEELARAWGLTGLHLLEPPVSPSQWIADHAMELLSEDDFHSRAAGLSKACFYEVVEAATAGHSAIFLGLRKDESRGRLVNRASHGPMYRRRDGRVVCTPIVDWSGLDVFAYLAAREIPVLDVYRCVAFMHATEPWRVRKSWWLPGAHAARGATAWLRHYYPSLYAQLCRWMPDARRLA